MRKRITSLLLTLVMLLSLVPAMGVTANAADGFVEVSTYEQLRNEVNKGSAKIKLTADIDTTSENSGVGVTSATNLSFKGSGNVLDLNGHKLKLVSNMSVYFIEIYSSDLTIKDSGTNGRIDFEYGEAVLGVQRAIVINRSVGVKKAGSLTVDGGTLSSTYLAIILIESYGSITINGGRLYAPVTNSGNSCYIIHSTNRYDLDDTLQLHVNGGELDGRVVLKRDDSSATGTLKYKVTPIKITNGTFKQGLYATWKTWDSPEGKPKNAVMTMDSPTVEITGGVFEKNNEEYSSYASSIRIDLPTKLRGGTFKNGATIRFVGGKYTWDATQPQYRASIGNSAILRGNDIRTAYDWSKSDWFEIQSPWIYLTPKGTSVTVIPNAWGMKSVTLDNIPIDYAKDFKGEVKEITNSTAHTLTFEWNSLADELVKAGYSYAAKCEHYVSGASGVQKTENIDADKISHTVTIKKGADPKVYSFDLQLNLQKSGSNIGIFGNEHIVRLVVDPAPVVTEISSAPVRLSAALTPDTPAPSAAAVGSGYTVGSIKWYTDNSCTNSASTFAAGTEYYGKIVLKPAENYKFAASASALFFCDDPNENYSIVGSSTVAEDGSSLTLVVKGTAVSALVWNSVDTNNQTYTIGDNALTLNAKATGGESGKPITYKLIAKKDGTETVKASAMVAASASDSFSAPLSFTDTGSYECWFEATRGNVTITSDHFTVTVNAPGLSIANQSGDLTVKQNAIARLFVKAVGHGVKYQWQVKNGNDWNAISGETAYDYAADTTDAGEKTYRCMVKDNYGGTKYTNEMTVTVTEVADSSLTPTILLAAVNGDAPDPAKLWPDKDVEPNGWLGLKAEYDVTAGDTFHGVATFSTIPTGFNMNGHDIYYDSYNNIQKTPVLGTISYEWEGTTKNPWEASSGDFTSLGTDAHASFTIPSGVNTYYVKLSVMNTVGTETQTSTVYITFHVSAAHTHTYAYAQLNKDQHTKYCTAGDDSITETHTMENGVCKYCGYAPAKTYSVTVTDGSATPDANVAPGTKVTLTANTAPSGQVFDNWVGNVTVASDSTFTMPSHNVTVAATYKPAHAHDTDAQSWVYMDPGTHTKTCTAGDDFKMEAHTFSAWTDNGNGTHSRHCTACKMTDGSTYTETAEHTWVWVVDHEAALNQPGKQHEECTGCPARRSENTVIPMLTAISAVNVTVTAPVKGAAPGIATTADTTTYNVAATDWEPIVSSTFAGGTKYTVKVSLEATGNNRFTDKTTFQINGQTAKLDGTIPATGLDNTIITLTFPATEGGSTGGGGGGGVTTYPITVKSAKNGDVTASHKTASKGTAVTLTVDPDKGYVLDTLTVLDGKDKEIKLTEKNGKYTFTMPASKVTVEAAFKASAPTGKNPFVDVPAGSYYEDAVIWAVGKGITTGTSATTFNPNGICTRAQAVTFLWRAAGSPAAKSSAMPFADVKAGSYYYDAVLWAVEQGITKGTGDTMFSPDATCTRAQIVTFLWRANGSPAASGNSAFTDVASDAYYAAAVTWAEKDGVTGGIGGGLFGSNNNCTRAQIVTFIYRSVK